MWCNLSVNLFEVQYLILSPFLPPLYGHIHSTLKRLTRGRKSLRILDVGGRKSHYTIGISAEITVTELPRETDIQLELNLGMNDLLIKQTMKRRSNISDIIFDNMEDSILGDETFDIVVAVEVLEHVEHDHDFIKNVQRVLKPGGLFLMSTPNGEYRTVISNPDHKRHYRRQQLFDLLSEYFTSTDVYYAIRGGLFRRWGLKSWSLRSPYKTLLSVVGNVINRLESRGLSDQPNGTCHLIAVAAKRMSSHVQ